MSSPMMKTSSSLRIACESASRTASRYDNSGIDVLQSVLRLGIGPGLGEVDRGVDELLHFPIERLVVRVGEPELLPQELDRISGLLEALELVLVPVDLWVADVMADQALGLAEQEDRTLAVA